jgi:hypothetical protein
MRSAHKVHPEFNSFCQSPNLRRKAGYAVAFIVFGSIGGASGVVVQMAGNEPHIDGRSVIAAIPLNSDATLATIVSPASPSTSAPDNRQDSASPSNSRNPHWSMQTPQWWQRRLPQRRQSYPSSLLLLPRSRKKRCAARTGATEAGTTLLRGAAMPTNDQVRAGDQPQRRAGTRPNHSAGNYAGRDRQGAGCADRS